MSTIRDTVQEKACMPLPVTEWLPEWQRLPTSSARQVQCTGRLGELGVAVQGLHSRASVPTLHRSPLAALREGEQPTTLFLNRTPVCALPGGGGSTPTCALGESREMLKHPSGHPVTSCSRPTADSFLVQLCIQCCPGHAHSRKGVPGWP